MKETRLLMGMPITVEVVDAAATDRIFQPVFDYFAYVDAKFSTYKKESEISLINEKRLHPEEASADMRTILALAEETRKETMGYFDIRRNGHYDPSGLVKGWAIKNASEIIKRNGFRNYYVEAGGDIQASGQNDRGENWRVGIRNPFKMNEIVKVLAVTDCGVATSGTYVRGQHIYDPKGDIEPNVSSEIVSLTVIGPDIYEADRFATAAFAMGKAGILFLERREGLEAFMIDRQGQATLTSGLERYIARD